jgi:hypothetical protein
MHMGVTKMFPTEATGFPEGKGAPENVYSNLRLRLLSLCSLLGLGQKNVL